MSEKKIFLVIDDDPDDCFFFREALRKIDVTAECLVASDGEAALIMLRNGINQMPHLIFLDLNMPRMDGRLCLTELKKDSELKNIPVIILSTSSYQKDIDETKKLGAVYFITKPIGVDKLRSEISFAIQSFHDAK